MAGWRTLVAGGGAALTLALASGAGYQPDASAALRQPAAEAVELTVVMVGGAEEIVTGRPVTYAIQARNVGQAAAEVALRASVPARMYEVLPADAGQLTHGVVEWPPVAIPAGRSLTVHVTGVYGPAESEEPRAARVAFTVCALDPDEGAPMVCATAVAQTTSGDARWPYGIALVIAAGAFAGALVWRQRYPARSRLPRFMRGGRPGLRSHRAERDRSPGPGSTPGPGPGTGPVPDRPPGGSPPSPPPARPVKG